MKIDQAIVIKERTGEEFLQTDPDELDEAERLSIEALKRLQEQRSGTGFLDEFDLLPGETKD